MNDSSNPVKAMPRRLLGLLAGLVLGLGACGLRAQAHAADVRADDRAPILIQHRRGESVEWVRYLLIPAPLAQVKSALQGSASERAMKGFTWRDESAPLWTLDTTWQAVSLRFRPEVRQMLSDQAHQAAHGTLAQALSEGVVSADEKIAFEAALSRKTRFEDETIQHLPFFAQRIERWIFTRTRSGGYADAGGVMDVSPMLAQTPMTLVWFSGSRTHTEHSLRLFSCMTGVTCFPAPGIDTTTRVEPAMDPGLSRHIDQVGARLHALDGAEGALRMRDFIDSRKAPTQPEVRDSDSDSAPNVDAATHDLPTDESRLRSYDDKRWRLLPLPDGTVLAAGATPRRYTLRGGAIAAADISPRFDAHPGADSSVRIDAQGTVWGFTRDASTGALRLLAWSSRQDATRTFPMPALEPNRVDEWTPLFTAGPGTDAGIALRAYGELYTLDGHSGRFQNRTWNHALRREASDRLDDALPWLSGQRIHFGDGLFWGADRDLYGISPGTGRVVAAIPMTTKNVFYGSREAGWALATGQGSDKMPLFRIVDLSNGQPRFDWRTPAIHYPAALARTAHGQLLATASGLEDAPITVLDMRRGQPLVNLRLPKDYYAMALAFSWNGDRLWAYIAQRGPTSQRKLLVWEVPDAHIDRASPGMPPDQIRCDGLGGTNSCRP